jgi:hypothetical protein
MRRRAHVETMSTMIGGVKYTGPSRRPAAVIALAWIACLAPLSAAEFHELDTDRDAFTPATTTAKAGTVLTEASYVWIDNRGLPATNSFPELLVRIGARERLEWRFGFNYEQNSGGSVVAAVEVGEPPREGTGSEEANLLYGIKVRVTDQADWLPRSAVIVEAFTPVAGDIWGTEPSATYAFGWELPAAWRLDTAIRYVRAESEEGWFDRWMPSTVLRIPVTERFEWRLGFNYEQNSGGSVVAAVEVGEPPDGESGGEEANLLYGCKLRVTDQEGWIPRSSAIVEAFTPVAGDIWGTEPSATYAFGWELPTEWRFDTAIRYARAESVEGWFDRWMPSAVLRIPVTDRWEVHAEWFGSWSQGLADDSVQPFAGPGTHFMLTPTFEIGCRMGWGLTRDAAGYFVDSGVGWRF